MMPQVLETNEQPFGAVLTEGHMLAVARQAILLHSCCGPCSTAVVERLAARFDITLFFYNPNITDRDEYERRLEAQRRFVDRYNMSPDTDRKLTLVIGAYEPGEFFARVRGLEAEPEGGARCALCFEMRLQRAAEYAALHAFERFTTTLSVSPHKNHALIRDIGTRLAMKFGLTFHPEDFKKNDGARRSAELARAYGLYRQNYCGCDFSRRAEGTGEVRGMGGR
jgi:predicted adenine nucleotide alpha hydrolase (AANH) superfamily ATPase